MQKILKVLMEAAVALIVVIAISNFSSELTNSYLLDRYQAGNQVILRLLGKPEINSISTREAEVNDNRVELEGFGPANSEIDFQVNGIRAGYYVYSSEKRYFEQSVWLRRGVNQVVASAAQQAEHSEAYIPETVWRIRYRPPDMLNPEIIYSASSALPVIGGEARQYRHWVWGTAEPYAYVETCLTEEEKHWRQLVRVDDFGLFTVNYLSAGEKPIFSISTSTRDPEKREVYARPKTLQSVVVDELDDSTPCPGAGFGTAVYRADGRDLLVRQLKVTEAGNGLLSFTGRITLPARAAVVTWARLSQIRARDLLYYFFNFADSIEPGARSWSGELSSKVSVKDREIDNTAIIEFTIAARLPRLTFIRGSDYLPGFLRHAQDRLVVSSSDLDAVDTNFDADEKEDGILTWRGGRTDGGNIRITFAAEKDTPARQTVQKAQKRQLERSTDQNSPIDAINRLAEILPNFVRELGVWGLLAIPMFGFLIVLRQVESQLDASFRLNAAAFTVTLLLLHFGYILVWFAEVDLYTLLAPLAPSNWDLQGIERITRSTPELLFGAVACSALLARQLAAAPRDAEAARGWLWSLGKWIVLLPAAIAILYGIVVWRYYSFLDDGVPVWMISVAAVALSLILAWPFMHWLFGTVLRRSLSARVSLFAVLGLILVPALPKLIGALTSWLQLYMLELGYSPFVIPSGTSDFAWFVIVTGTGGWLLWLLFSRMLMLAGKPLPAGAARNSLIALWILVAMPFSYFHGEQIGAWTLVSFFDDVSFSLRYLILLPIYLLLKKISAKDDFGLHTGEILLLALVFAFYLCGQSTNLLLVPIPLLLGWYLFNRHLLHEPATLEEIAATQDRRDTMIQQLLDLKEAQRLRQLYKKHAETSYATGKLERDALEKGLELASERVDQARGKLGTSVGEARAAIFSFGPEADKWSNARNAVLYSIPVVILFQLGTVDRALSDEYRRIFPLLDIVIPPLGGTFVWIICAFLFGYLFHRIRGRNGIEKALAFFIALILPGLVAIILSGDSLLGDRAGDRVMRIAIFLFYLGLFAFDMKTLRNRGRKARDLITVYGLGPVIAFASSFLALGSVAIGPILVKAFEWLVELAKIGGNGG